MPPDEALVRTPATVGNFGPGFDVTSLALAWGGDTITAVRLEDADEDEVRVEGPGAEGIPAEWGQNAAALAFEAVRVRLGAGDRIRLAVHKGVPAGSGLGSSAASAAGGVLAALRLFPPDEPWAPSEMLQAALKAEEHVAGKHGDDVAAALLGGLAMVRGDECARWDPPEGLAVAIVRPVVSLSTREMRELVPERVTVRDAVGNLADLAFLLEAWSRGDAEQVARSLQDRLAAPARREWLPFFETAQRAARDAGVPRIAISGSGPSLFTVTAGLVLARNVAGAMADAVRESGVEAEPVACLPEARHVWKEALSWS